MDRVVELWNGRANGCAGWILCGKCGVSGVGGRVSSSKPHGNFPRDLPCINGPWRNTSLRSPLTVKKAFTKGPNKVRYIQRE